MNLLDSHHGLMDVILCRVLKIKHLYRIGTPMHLNNLCAEKRRLVEEVKIGLSVNRGR